MIFSIEVLQAQQGDCLIVHYGKLDTLGLIVIDGGPSGIYREYLKPRLAKIRQKLMGDDPLPLKMIMVSHADDDHINGILSMTNDLVGQIEDSKPLPYEVDNFWFNSFDDIIGNKEISAALYAKSVSDTKKVHISAVIASTGQGRTLRNNVNKLGWLVNEPFTELKGTKTRLIRGDIDSTRVPLGGLGITVLHPTESRLKELQKQWDKDLQKAKESGDNSVLVASLNSSDKSPFNLSSIVCMLEFKGKRMLLTGDGRCDDIYDGLKQNKFLDVNGKLHVDILKMPHHGSNANMKPAFLENITADHYVISADGKHNNPDKETLEMIVENIKKGTLYLTNHDGELGLKAKLDKFIKQLNDSHSKLKVHFREPNKPSLIINLLDDINY